MRWITTDDFIETWTKVFQKGSAFWISRFHPDPLKRTKGTFDEAAQESGSYWWMIPAVRKRINARITGSEEELYETYCCKKYFAGKKNLKMLSLGTGTCTHEIRFAQSGLFAEVKCIDLSENVLKAAQQNAENLGLQNMLFETANVNEIALPEAHYDAVLFHSSLHHFENVAALLRDKIAPALKKDGLLIIHEFTGANRLQFPKHQIAGINKTLCTIPNAFRKRYKSNFTKSNISGAGYLRMLITDPSECVESEEIIPAIHRHFTVFEEKALGGNLLMLVFKDIAHHFFQPNEVKTKILDKVFKMEDDYLRENASDFVFGVYGKGS